MSTSRHMEHRRLCPQSRHMEHCRLCPQSRHMEHRRLCPQRLSLTLTQLTRTPWLRFFLEKLLVPRLVTIIPTCYGHPCSCPCSQPLLSCSHSEPDKSIRRPPVLKLQELRSLISQNMKIYDLAYLNLYIIGSKVEGKRL